MAIAVQGEMTASPRPQLWRLSDRSRFAALRSSGRRARRNGITVTFLPPASGTSAVPPRVAFAVGRRSGGAVLRNRIRRRLRAGLRELQGQGRVPAGDYLVSADPDVATLPWTELLTALGAALDAATGSAR